MEIPQIAQDDLMDVVELSDRIEKSIIAALEGNAKNIGVSALMSANLNFLFSQCSCLSEVMFYRNLFVEMLDGAIEDIKIRNPESP